MRGDCGLQTSVDVGAKGRLSCGIEASQDGPRRARAEHGGVIYLATGLMSSVYTILSCSHSSGVGGGGVENDGGGEEWLALGEEDCSAHQVEELWQVKSLAAGRAFGVPSSSTGNMSACHVTSTCIPRRGPQFLRLDCLFPLTCASVEVNIILCA